MLNTSKTLMGVSSLQLQPPSVIEPTAKYIIIASPSAGAV